MLIAAFNAARSVQGVNPHADILFYGQDISRETLLMAYVQCSLLGMSGIFTWGNSLTREARDVFHTPFYRLNWRRFAGRETEEARALRALCALSGEARPEAMSALSGLAAAVFGGDGTAEGPRHGFPPEGAVIVTGKQRLLFDEVV
jgi:hypothetical protein